METLYFKSDFLILDVNFSFPLSHSKFFVLSMNKCFRWHSWWTSCKFQCRRTPHHRHPTLLLSPHSHPLTNHILSLTQTRRPRAHPRLTCNSLPSTRSTPSMVTRAQTIDLQPPLFITTHYWTPGSTLTPPGSSTPQTTQYLQNGLH